MEIARLSSARPLADTSLRPRPAPWAGRATWVALVAILALGFALRLLYLRQVAALPFFDNPVGDSAAHLHRAAEIAAGRLLPSRPFFYCSIFYPYFLAGALTLFHGSLFAVCLVQVVSGVALAALLATLAGGLFGPTAAIGAALLAALYGPFAFFEADVLGVAWGQLALMAGIALCLLVARARERGARIAPWSALAAGFAFGFAVVERPNLLLVAVLAAAWCAWRAGARAAARTVLPFAFGLALPLAAVLALNVAGSGQWVPLTTSAGINLYLGYHPGGTGTFEEPWAREAPEFAARHTEWEEASITRASVEAGRPLTPQQASAWWTQKTLRYVRAHPREAAFVTLRKAALLLNGSEVPNHLDIDFIRERAPALWLMPVGFAAVFGLAALGFGDALRTRRRRAGMLLLFLAAAGAAISLLPFTVADRYRAPLVPPLIVAAGAGFAALVRLVRERESRAGRGVVWVLLGALAAVAIAAIPLQRPLRGRDYWMLASAYQAHGDARDAAAAYEQAVRAGGDDAELLNNLALAYKAMGERERAIATLRGAIATDPRLSAPHKNLGLLLIGRGASDAAIAELAEADRLTPDDPETLGALGALQAERGDAAGARAVFARAQALAPDDARLARLVRAYTPQPAAAGRAEN